MMIGSVGGTNSQAAFLGKGQETDSYSRNIQNQIIRAQKQLQELSSSQEMPLEEKMNRRQEIIQEINDLNNRLRQHQMEMRRQEGAKRDDSMGQASPMQEIISADASIKQVQIQESAKTGMDGRARVLKAEIKQNKGKNTTGKEAELAELEEKSNAVNRSQMNTLSDIGKRLRETSKEDEGEDKKEQDGQKADGQKEDAQTTENTELPLHYAPVDVRL